MPRDEDIRTLLDAARAGDREALNRLLESCQERLRRMSAARLGGRLRAKTRASDVLQSTYLEVMRSIGEFEGKDEKTFVAWVGSILEHHVKRKVRYFSAQRRKDPSRTSEIGRAKEPSDNATPSIELRKAEDMLTVSHALDNLPEHYREVILMKVVDGLDHQEIAKATGRTPTATRMLLSRARARLCMEIERLEGDA